MNRDRAGGHDFAGHAALDVDVGHPHPPKALNVRFSLNNQVLSANAAGNFPDQVDRHRIFALKISAHFPFDDGRGTNHTCAAEIALARQMDIAASANRATEAGGDFVIAEINVRAATGTIGRARGIADFMFAFAFETRDKAIALPAPNAFELAMKG